MPAWIWAEDAERPPEKEDEVDWRRSRGEVGEYHHCESLRRRRRGGRRGGSRERRLGDEEGG